MHQRFRPEHVEAFRAEHPDGIVMVHPECAHEVVELGDVTGSTDAIIRAVAAAPSGSVIGVATEIHLVNRLDNESPDKTVVCLDPLVCPCSTMSRIDPQHLAWVLEGLVERRGAEPDRRRRRDGGVGQGRARADACHHLTRELTRDSRSRCQVPPSAAEASPPPPPWAPPTRPSEPPTTPPCPPPSSHRCPVLFFYAHHPPLSRTSGGKQSDPGGHRP